MFKEHTNRARYIRLVDEKPSSFSFTDAGDIICGVEVGMELEAALPTPILMSFPVSFIDIPTTRTFLAGVSWVDVDNMFAECFSLVLNKGLQLPERPVAKHFIESMSKSFLSFDTKRFKSDSVTGLIYNPFSNAVIRVSHKLFLSTRHLFKFTFGRASAFLLKFLPQMLVSTLNRSNMLTIVKEVIGEHCMVIDSSVHSEYILDGSGFWSIGFCYNVELESAIVNGESRIAEIPIEVLPKIFRYNNRNFYSTINTRERCNRFLTIERECPDIEPNSGIKLFDWQSFEPFTFEHFRCIIPCTSNKGCWEIMFFPDGIISEMVQSEFIVNPILISDFQNVVYSFIVDVDGIDKSFIRFDIDSNSPLHINSLVYKVYTYLEGG